MIEEIRNILNKPFGDDLQGQSRKYVCWVFCRKVYEILGLPPLKQAHKAGLQSIAKPVVPCIVLFHISGEWHSGVVYPDTLHFIHAAPLDIQHRETTKYVACKERLTVWPYNLLIEGYYDP